MRSPVLPLALLASLAAVPAYAHKVVASVYPDGDAIEGEVGFSNGDMAREILVEIFDGAGTKIGEARTDADGIFRYRPTQRVDHVFRADLGAGHVAETTMTAEELPGGGDDRPAPGPVAVASVSAAAPPPGLRDMVAEAVRNEVKPLRREIAAYKEKNDLQAILGGIGYIIGLFGVGFYLAARRKLRQS